MKVTIRGVVVELGALYRWGRDDLLATEVYTREVYFKGGVTIEPEEFGDILAKVTPLPDGPSIEIGRIYPVNGGTVEPCHVTETLVGCMDENKQRLPYMRHEKFLDSIGQGKVE